MHAPLVSFPPDIVRASAGAGKTFELTTRYMALLAAGESPDHILATTFTRKAAGEIHDRVLSRLAEAAADEHACRALSAHLQRLGLPGLDCGGARTLLVRLVHHLHRLSICTLDSFFIRIGASFSFELGMPLGWTIIDDVSDRRLQAEAIRGVLNEADHAMLVQLIRLMTGGEVKRAVHAEIMRTVQALYAIYRQTSSEAWHWLIPPRPLSDDRLIAAIAALGELPITPPPPGVVKAIQGDQQRAMARDWLTFLSKGIAAKVVAGEATYSRWSIAPEAQQAYQVLVDHAQAELLGRLANQTRATHTLLERFDSEYRRLKLAHRVMRFDDVTHELARSAVAGESIDLYYRLDAQVRHLLLDEFQDTSLDQWHVLAPIAEEVVAAGGAERSLFCVGDVKQAIYGWRGGVAEIFDHLNAKWPHITPRAHNQTRRCSQPVVDVVNFVFEDLPSNPALARCADAVTRWAGRFSAHTTASTAPGFIRLLTAPRADADQKQLETTLIAAARLVKQIVEQAPGFTVGVLTRSNAAVARLIYELRRPEIGLIASEEGGNPLTDSPAVAVVLSLLRMADHPGDTASRFHVAASPMGAALGFVRFDDHSAATRLASDIRHELMTHGYGATLFRLTELLAGACEQRDLNRLLQLVELGHAYQPRATLRPRDFIDVVNATRIADPTASPVRVMTVHQAKGLEFDSVVLPELDCEIGRVGSVMMLCDRPDPLSPPFRVVRYPRQELRGLEPVLGRMYDQAVAARVQDDLSAFYVAMTRARYALHMLIAPSKENEKTVRCTYAGVLRHTLVGMTPVEPRQELYRRGDVNWFASARPGRPPSQPAPQTLDVKLAPAKSRRRHLLRRTPSSLEGGTHVDIARLMDLRDGGRSFGLAMHLMFQQVQWLDEAEPDAAVLGEAAAAGDDPQRLMEAFTQAVAIPAVRRLLCRSAYTGRDVRLHREQRFIYRDAGTLISGTIDRLVVEEVSGRATAAHVIDFKTDSIADGTPAVEAAVNHYRPQMEAYRRAVAAMHRLERSRVRVTLLFVGPGVAVDV